VLDKRLKENNLSGAIVQVPGKYKLSPTGERIVHALALIGWFFSAPDESFSQNPASASGFEQVK
jgi:hypothetical protein